MASWTTPACQMKAANTARILSATEGLMASTTGPEGARSELRGWDLCWLTAGGRSGTLGLTATTGGGSEVNIGGSGTSFKLSLDISIDVVDIWNTWFESDLLGLDCLLCGLSDLIWSDLRDTGDIEPVSSLLRLAGEGERPDMSLVRLDTRAEVSD